MSKIGNHRVGCGVMPLDLFKKLLSTAPDFIQEQVLNWLRMAEDAIRADERMRLKEDM